MNSDNGLLWQVVGTVPTTITAIMVEVLGFHPLVHCFGRV